MRLDAWVNREHASQQCLFFSSRMRHTRYWRDWSSDVCSSDLTVENDRYRLSSGELVGADIFLDEMSVTGTEQAIMAASLAEGATVIRNAASEPHVQDLCRCLNRDRKSVV